MNVSVKVLDQGKVELSSFFATVIRYGTDIVAFTVDMRTKHADVFAHGWNSVHGSSILLVTTEDSLYLLPVESDFTEICFPEYKDWHIFTTAVSRYTLKVCLIKGDY